jgi:hypothetical protein
VTFDFVRGHFPSGISRVDVVLRGKTHVYLLVKSSLLCGAAERTGGPQ